MDITTLVPVCVGACLCPGTPHADGDFVYLRPKLSLASGIILQEPVNDWLQVPTAQRPGQEFMRAELSERYLTLGIAEWNIEDEAGVIPVNSATIRIHLLDDYFRSQAVADKADDLYSEVALDPLRKLVAASSAATSTNGSTSATGSGSPKRRKRSKPSLTSTTPMDATATTSS